MVLIGKYNDIEELEEESCNLINKQVSSLPIIGYKNKIVELLKNNEIIIVEAETGSGKSTQLIKILSSFGKIISTQPRVPAAIALSSRVTNEILAENFGEKNYDSFEGVGYKTGLYKSEGNRKNEFHTDGYEFARITSYGDFKNLIGTNKLPDVIILDEFHTFSIPTEGLAYILKEIKKVQKRKKGIKIVVTSATMDTEHIKNYFSEINNGNEIPVEKIPGRTFEINRKEKKQENHISEISIFYSEGKNILVFESGKGEIKETIGDLKSKLGENLDVRILNRDMNDKEIESAMKKPDIGNAIIVATNIAQESLTIDWIDCVVDSGKVKEASTDEFGVNFLKEIDEPKSGCTQRAGRAGRTKPGEATRTNDTKLDDVPEYRTAPIKLSILDAEVLRFLSVGICIKSKEEQEEEKYEKGISKNNSIFPNKPNKGLLLLSYERLEKLGAVEQDELGKYYVTNEGRDLLKYPISPSNAKILLEGIKRGTIKSSILIASLLENESFIANDADEKALKNLEKINNEKNKDSEIFNDMKLFTLLCSRHISDIMMDLIKTTLGFSSESVEKFINENGKIMFFESLTKEDIEKFGIKTKILQQILDTKEKLEEKVRKPGEDIKDELKGRDLFKNLKFGLFSGLISYIYRLDGNSFVDDINENNKRKFILSKSSSIDKKRVDGTKYVGIPFVIEKDGFETALFTKVTVFSKKEMDEIEKINEEKSNVTKFENKTSNLINTVCNEFNSDKVIPKSLRDKEELLNYIGRYIKIEDTENFQNIEFLRRLYVLIKYIPYLIIKENNFIKKDFNKANTDFYKTNIYKLVELLKNYISINYEKYIHLVSHRLNKDHLYRTFRDDTWLINDFISDNIDSYKKLLAGEYVEVETRYINNKSKNNTQSNNGSKESINIKNKIETIQNYLEKQQVSIYDINELKSYILEQLFKNKDISKKLYYILNLLFSYKGDLSVTINKIIEIDKENEELNSRKNKLINFIKSLEEVLSGENSSLGKIFKRYKSKDEFLLNDEKISIKLRRDIDIIKDIYNDIKNFIGNIDNKTKKSVEGYIYKIFSVDQRRRKNGLNGLRKEYEKLLEKRNNKTINNSEKKYLELLGEYLTYSNAIINEIDKNKYNNVLEEKKGKKDFINAVAIYVVNGDYDMLYDDSKISENNNKREKISKLFDKLGLRNEFGDKEIKEMIETFSLIDIEDDTAKEIIRKKIEKYILLYKKYFSKIEKKIEENKDTISQVEPSIIGEIIENIYYIIGNIYDKPEEIFNKNKLKEIIKLLSEYLNNLELDKGKVISQIENILNTKYFEESKKLSFIFESIRNYELALGNLEHYRDNPLNTDNVELLEKELKLNQETIDKIKKLRKIIISNLNKISYQYGYSQQ